jgi:hypothetical protein
MVSKHPSQPEPGRDARDVNQRVHDAITDLSAYALTLDREYHRLTQRVLELAAQESSAAERSAVVRERAEIAEELSAFRRTIRALARAAPPARESYSPTGAPKPAPPRRSPQAKPSTDQRRGGR